MPYGLPQEPFHATPCMLSMSGCSMAGLS